MPDRVAITVALAVAALVGAVLQGLGLRRLGLPSGAWAVATALGAALGWALVASVITTVASAAAAGLVAGAIAGLVQWLVLRWHARRAWPWIPASALAWAVGSAAVVAAGSGVAGGLVGGLLLGLATTAVAATLRPWVDGRPGVLAGKVVVVTGVTSGIGRAAFEAFARMGATTIGLGLPAEALDATVAAVRRSAGNADVHGIVTDLSRASSVASAIAAIRSRHDRVDVLVNNAGATFRERRITADGIEATLAVDVVGPIALTLGLEAPLRAARGRVVNLAGRFHAKGWLDPGDLALSGRPYDPADANAAAQLGRVLWTRALARRWHDVTVNAVHPGAVRTGAQADAPWPARLLFDTLLRPVFVRPAVGALPVLRVATDPALAGVSGRWFRRFADAEPAPAARDDEAAQALLDAGAALSTS